MNKTININLAGIIFHVDEEAYQVLTDYLKKLKAQFSRQEGAEEILMDVEARIAELFTERLAETRQVIDMKDVNAVIETMGQPEDYAEGDEEEPYTDHRTQREYTGPRRLYRDTDENILGGVCSGLAAYFSIDPIWIRLAFVALVLLGSTGFWLYIILWIVIPEAKTTAQKLQMRGEKINLSNIEKSVKEELKSVGRNMDKLGKDERIRRGGNRIAQAIEDIVGAVLNIVGAVLKVVFKILGVILLFGGILFLVVLFSALAGYGVEVNGDAIGFGTLYNYGMALFPSGYGPTYLWVAISLTAIGPIIGLVALGSRILFNFKLHSKPATAFAGLATLAGLVMFLVLGFATAAEFKVNESERTDFAIENASKDVAIVIAASDKEFNMKYNTPWYADEEQITIGDIDFDVRRTSETEPYIEIVRESNGRSRSRASELIEDIRFDVVQDSQTIFIDKYLTVPLKDKFRGQEVNVILYLPEGFSVYLDRSIKYIINDIKNVTNTYDRYMVDHVWMMTSKGLACADCVDMPDDNRSIDHDEWKEQWIDDAREMEEELENAPRTPVVPVNESRETIPQRSESAFIEPVVFKMTPYEQETILI